MDHSRYTGRKQCFQCVYTDQEAYLSSHNVVHQYGQVEWKLVMALQMETPMLKWWSEGSQ